MAIRMMMTIRAMTMINDHRSTVFGKNRGQKDRDADHLCQHCLIIKKN